MQRLLILMSFFIFYAFSSAAQTGWQWGKRGGSSASGIAEGEVEMVTDQQGNLYVLAKISKGEPGDIDGYISDSANNQLSLSKWGCDGSHKWTKYFGGTGSVYTIGSSLSIDSLGGLYFTGSTSTVESAVVPQYVYFDQDIAPYNSRKGWFIIKYDTAGVFQWFRMPQADTVTVGPGSSGTANKVAAIGLDAAPNGDVYVLAYLPHGIFSGAYVNTVPNTFHLMRYSKDGNFLDAKVVDMSVSSTIAEPGIVNLQGRRTGFARDHNSGRFYLSGWYNSNWGSLTFGSTSLEDVAGGGTPMYLSAFDSNGNHMWVEQTEPSISTNVPDSRPRIDEEGNIYICGASFQGNTFFGHTITNTYTTSGLALFILSVDSAGNLRWAINSRNSNVLTDLKGLSYAKGIVSVSDAWQYYLSWGSDSVTSSTFYGGNHLSRFNAHTGMPIKNIDTFRMTGPSSGTTDLATDHKGNVYVGGLLSYQVFLPSVTLSNIGGTFDFFVAKYGAADCNCVMPVPDFTYSSASGSTAVNFTYTGTGGTVDSVRWEFGDGAMASGFSTSHTYATAGTYEVSIVMYSNCGMTVIAQKVTTGGGTGITVPGLSAQLIVYPNPTQQYITIDKAGTNTDIAFYNTIGQKVLQRKAQQENETIDVSALSSGIYIIRIYTPDGKKGSVKFVKE